MPVLKIFFDRFERLTGLPREQVLDRLPYLGLDIEGTDAEGDERSDIAKHRVAHVLFQLAKVLISQDDADAVLAQL